MTQARHRSVWKRLGAPLAGLLLLPLAGCNMVVMAPAGDVAAQQRDLILISTGLMLLVIIPVMVLTVLFAWRYRAANKDAAYDPDWDHSTRLELVIWAIPLLIVIALGAFTWMGTHLLDPYRPLGRVAADRPIEANVEPLEVEVVALDWKWLFILPQYGIATVNDLAAPVDRPIRFKLTASTVMNAFYVPTLAGMIYAMPGMETTLHGVINHPGTYDGFSSHYSGAGFSKMRFKFHGVDQAGFDTWVNEARTSGQTLDRTTYLELAEPSEGVPVMRYAGVDPALFDAVVNLCAEPGRMCMSEMMAIDARGGLGLASLNATLPLVDRTGAPRGATVLGPAPRFVASICTEEEALAALRDRPKDEVRDRFTAILGLGLPRPLSALGNEPVISRADAPLDLLSSL
ncbi:ubiquinol oxidase subunit II [Aureimonas jatrophae]|uniref:Ubiquinol oxidase polypeptide II n=1 Tax=Aureimonas jatrophae TaxID=1166073 RepID=A0A1H0F3Z8_9HYPH|nr:ubiquinol oxidase subunit II [Aureimonas jatrophae]MBB3950190.1 cytochrome o ubiquinol oxidase subunit 2 [Aureimonas jatrophae]SDN89387.1 cytochrome bo3 quinol oxidase subunit 2 [Aureimonas jatrophae]